MFSKPTSVTYISNGFHSTGKDKHFGVDFAENGINAIRASADGTVTRSYYSASYGECIMILHQISGQVYETVYAHLKSGSRKVKVGDSVKKDKLSALWAVQEIQQVSICILNYMLAAGMSLSLMQLTHFHILKQILKQLPLIIKNILLKQAIHCIKLAGNIIQPSKYSQLTTK